MPELAFELFSVYGDANGYMTFWVFIFYRRELNSLAKLTFD